MAKRKKQKQIGSFTYTPGSKIAFVKHYNIKKASLAKRELAAAELRIYGIQTISSGGRYLTIKKFLGLEEISNPKRRINGKYVPGNFPARYTHKPLELSKIPR
ncbi:MAG: hypothetical protein PHG82_04070 [Candidatus Gracilibacteria bacterium]|nr:hypothetical protein [Candidatus Gracilibacteria bacterium]